MVAYGSLPGLRIGTKPAPMRQRQRAPKMNPRASAAAIVWIPRPAKACSSRSIAAPKAAGAESIGVISLKTIPGLGKSWMSRRYSRRSIDSRIGHGSVRSRVRLPSQPDGRLASPTNIGQDPPVVQGGTSGSAARRGDRFGPVPALVSSSMARRSLTAAAGLRGRCRVAAGLERAELLAPPRATAPPAAESETSRRPRRAARRRGWRPRRHPCGP